MNERERFLRDLLKKELIPNNDFDEIFSSALKELPPQKAYIITAHYLDGKTFDKIAEDLNISRSRVGQLNQRSLEYIRKSKYEIGFEYGKEALELYNFMEEHQKEMNALETKAKLLKAFNEINGIKDKENIVLDDATKAIFKKIGIKDPEILLSFNERDFLNASAAFIANPEGRKKLKERLDKDFDYKNLLVTEIGLSTRASNLLLRNKLNTIGDVNKKTYDELKALKGMGSKTFDEIIEKCFADGTFGD